MTASPTHGARRRWTARAGATIAALAMAVSAAAQTPSPALPADAPDTSTTTTRAEILQRQREAKARRLPPAHQPGFTTRLWDFIGATYGPGASQWSGVTPRFGSIVSGGGFAMGARYRNTLLFDRRAELTLTAMGSTKRYYRLDGQFGGRRLGGTPLFALAEGGVREYTQEDFFGLGQETRREDRTNFLYRESRATLTAGIEPMSGLEAGGSLTWLRPSVGRGRDGLYPSVGERFTDADAPGLSSQPRFLVTSIFARADRVGNPEAARTGGAASVTWTRVSDRETGAFSYRQLDIDARHYIPFLQGKRVVVVRGLLSTTATDAGQQVPFYMQPFLGGRRTLRGYDDQRFRGPHLLLLQAEYRFEVWPALDMAVFVDGGTVGARRADLDLSKLKHDYGVSFRFGGEHAIFRVDLAYGGETRRFSVAFGDVF